jgi:hypothetical protein
VSAGGGVTGATGWFFWHPTKENAIAMAIIKYFIITLIVL